MSDIHARLFGISESLRSTAWDLRSMAWELLNEAPRSRTFRVGDLVKRRARTNDGPPLGAIGVVRHLHSDGLIGVEWADYRGGNTLLDRIRVSGAGWYVISSDLELCNPSEA